MYEFAIELAVRAGELLLDIQRRGANGRFATKRSHMDLVTEGDIEAEKLITGALRDRFPNHGVYGEESVSAAHAAAAGAPGPEEPWAEWTWTVDPVDGTTNYAHGLPLFAVNIGLTHNREPVLGVTHAPALGYTFWACEGRGAWLRRGSADTPLTVSTVDTLARAVLTTGFPYDRASQADNNLAEFAALDLLVQGVRRLGTAALALAWVAAGAVDAYWESRAQPWDWVPGAVLVREAGGRVTDYQDRPWQTGVPCMIASNGRPAFHAGLQETIAAARRQRGLSA